MASEPPSIHSFGKCDRKEDTYRALRSGRRINNISSSSSLSSSFGRPLYLPAFRTTTRTFVVQVLFLAFYTTSLSSFTVRQTFLHHCSSIVSPSTSFIHRFNAPPNGMFIDVNSDDDDNDEDAGKDEDDKGEIIFVVFEPDDNPSLDIDDDKEYDDEDEDEEVEDPYTKVASSEFQDDNKEKNKAIHSRRTRDAGASALLGNDELDATIVDWGGALSKLRDRVEDVESGKSQDPSHVLFRMMSSQTPNQLIGQFISNANPQVVQAMSGAIGSLLGGLSSPNMGVETLVRASGEKIGSLCFQLQMTGYMFRNAEYVLALKDLMNLKGRGLTLNDYKKAFDRLDSDGNGFIETKEITKLFQEVYDEGKVPSYEIAAFLEFFDQNKDGKISWDEFEKGLGAALATAQSSKADVASRLLEGRGTDNFDGDDEIIDVNTNVSGVIEIEMEDGKIVEVDAKQYMENLKLEAQKLKEALRKEKLSLDPRHQEQSNESSGLLPSNSANSGGMDIPGYIASRQGDVKSLTEGISPEVFDTMKKLVDFVLEGGDSGKGKQNISEREKAEMEMELPGSALQQLALWQIVLGYRLREEEAKGDYINLLKG